MSDVKVVFSAEGANAVVSSAGQVKQSLADVGGSQKDLASGSENLADTMGKSFGAIDLAATMHIAGQVVDAFVQGAEAIIAFSQEGAQLLRVEEAGESLARSMDVSMTSVMSSLRTASLGMIADSDLMLSANRALMLGVTDDAEKMGQLMEVAALRGRAMGLSTQQAFDDIVTGIGRSSPMILDNLGIVVDAQGNYEKYANSIGKTADELSKAEKQQALLNAVLEATAPLLEANSLQMDTAGKWEAMSAAQTNYFDGMKKQLAEATSWWADYWAAVFTEANAQNEFQNLEAELQRLGLWTQAMTDFRESTKTTTTSMGRGAQYEGFFWSAEADIAFVQKFLPELVKYQEGIITTTAVQADWYDANYEGVNSLNMMATAQENSTRKMHENLEQMKTDYANLADTLADANLDLEIAVSTFHESIGNQLAKGLKDAGIQGDELLTMLGAVDLQFGSTTLQTEQQARAFTEMLEALQTGDIEKFNDLATGFKDTFTPLQEGVQRAQEAVTNLEGQLDALNGKIIEVEIRINTVRTEGGSTTNKTPGGGYSGEVELVPNALGGPVYENTPYLVGERGPELFVPNSQGSIIPNYMLGGETNASFDIDYQRLGKVISESIIEAAEEGRIGNNVFVNENGRREIMNANFDLLRAYGDNR